MDRVNASGVFGSTISLQGTPVTVVLLVVNVLVWIAQEAFGGSENTDDLIDFGAKYGPLIACGDWWRLITPMFLHIGFFHLLANSFGLFIFGGMVERIFGSVAFAAIYLVAGVLGNLFSYWADIGIYHSAPIGAGASGAVFGIVGAFGSYLLLNRHVLGQMGRQAMMSVLFIVGINFVLGITLSGVDNMAHLGGLFGGALLALIIAPTQNAVVADFAPGRPMGYVHIETRRPGFGRLAASIAVFAIILTLIAMFIGGVYRDELSVPCSLVERLAQTGTSGQTYAHHDPAAGFTCLSGA